MPKVSKDSNLSGRAIENQFRVLNHPNSSDSEKHAAARYLKRQGVMPYPPIPELDKITQIPEPPEVKSLLESDRVLKARIEAFRLSRRA